MLLAGPIQPRGSIAIRASCARSARSSAIALVPGQPALLVEADVATRQYGGNARAAVGLIGPWTSVANGRLHAGGAGDCLRGDRLDDGQIERWMPGRRFRPMPMRWSGGRSTRSRTGPLPAPSRFARARPRPSGSCSCGSRAGRPAPPWEHRGPLESAPGFWFAGHRHTITR